MVILSEVGQPLKRESAWGLKAFWALLFLLSNSAFATEIPISLNQLNDCNWNVTYRGRTYDLAPLTREALARPIETDIRYALQRVPEANEHLNSMSNHLRSARTHTILASVFVSGFVVSRILRAGEKNTEARAQYDLASAATAVLFGAATLFSWRSTTDAKHELVSAVAAFNESSPYKIEPSVSGQAPVAE